MRFEIAPELRRVRSPGEKEVSGVPEARPDIADIVNTTNLEPIYISVEPSHSENISPNEQPTRPESPVFARRSLC